MVLLTYIIKIACFPQKSGLNLHNDKSNNQEYYKIFRAKLNNLLYIRK